jgi:hypothetical protein
MKVKFSSREPVKSQKSNTEPTSPKAAVNFLSKFKKAVSKDALDIVKKTH